MTVFKKFVQIGRVVYITTGVGAGKLGAVVDVISVHRLLVDGPGLGRREIKLRDCTLTNIVLKVPHGTTKRNFLKEWTKSLVEKRFELTIYAKKLRTIQKREKTTDFGYFKVRTAQRTCNKIIDGAFRTLRHKNPRSLMKLENHRRHAMAVKLGYKKEKKFTTEKKEKMAARKIVRTENLKVLAGQHRAEAKERRVKRREKRKAGLAKLAAAGKLKPREFVPKEKRVRKAKAKPKPKPTLQYASALTVIRREREATRKATKTAGKELCRSNNKARLEQSVLRKAALAKGESAPAKLRLKWPAYVVCPAPRTSLPKNVKKNAAKKTKLAEAKKAKKMAKA